MLVDLETKVIILELNLRFFFKLLFLCSFLGYAITILDDDKELKLFKLIINRIENVQIKMLPIVIDKPILEYADNELENLNLTIEYDDKTNIIKDNKNGKIMLLSF